MKYIKGLVWTALLIVLDQLSKYWATIALKDKPPIVLWKGIFELQYLENRGMAFGLLQNRIGIFLIMTILILGVIVYYYYRVPDTKRMCPLRIAMIVLGAGAVGNMIDRVVNNYVIDFLYFKAINFPIFNVADCYVTVSFAALIILVLFYYKEEELNFHA